MKILFLGDYSNLHATLSAELKKRGHQVTLVSDRGGSMLTDADVYLSRKPGLYGAVAYAGAVLAQLPRWRGFDVVQIINPHFLNLRPSKIRKIFDYLRRNNGSIFLTLAGNDHTFVDACMNSDMFRFSEFRVGSRLTEYETTIAEGRGWLAPELKDLDDHIYGHINGAMSVLPEYDMAARSKLGGRLLFTNLPVDVKAIPWKPLEINGPVRLFIGLKDGREVQKGTDILLGMAKRLETRYPGKCIVTEARNLSLKDYLAGMSESHIVLDQLYSYSPATNALQAMAMGKVVGSGAQPEYYSYLDISDEDSGHPIIPLSPLMTMEEWEERFALFMEHPESLRERGVRSRQLVETHNDVRTIAPLFENQWNAFL